jgi:hypothetical protein
LSAIATANVVGTTHPACKAIDLGNCTLGRSTKQIVNDTRVAPPSVPSKAVSAPFAIDNHVANGDENTSEKYTEQATVCGIWSAGDRLHKRGNSKSHGAIEKPATVDSGLDKCSGQMIENLEKLAGIAGSASDHIAVVVRQGGHIVVG